MKQAARPFYILTLCLFVFMGIRHWSFGDSIPALTFEATVKMTPNSATVTVVKFSKPVEIFMRLGDQPWIETMTLWAIPAGDHTVEVACVVDGFIVQRKSFPVTVDGDLELLINTYVKRLGDGKYKSRVFESADERVAGRVLP